MKKKVDEQGYEHRTYGTTRVHLLEGDYSRKDLLEVIATIDEINAAAKRSVMPIKK